MEDDSGANRQLGNAPIRSLYRPLLVVFVLVALIFATQVVIRVEQVTRPKTTVANAKVDVAPLQSIDGFGASGAWWSQPVYGMSASAKAKVGKLLFSGSGLELSQFRYNIGGGGVGVTTWWKSPPTFLQPNGSYNFADDPGGVYFLKMAKSYGVADLVGFANSAPVEFTSNGLNCGGTLLRNEIPAYANYLTKVVLGIWKTFGIKLNYISPMNEPDGSMSACKQEGMRVPVLERAPLVVALGKDLAMRAPWCHIIADESSVVAFQLIPELPRWITRLDAKKYVAVVAHHTYDYPGPKVLTAMKLLLAHYHLPSWTTEICCFNGKTFGYQYDPTMRSGMWLAKSIFKDLVYGGDSAFDWWLAVSPSLGCEPALDSGCAERANILGRNDGLVYYDINYPSDHNMNLYLTKRYFVLGNYSRFIPPGSILHSVSGLPSGVMALATEKQGAWSLVVINDRARGSAKIRISIQLPTQVPIMRLVSSALTSASASWARVEGVGISRNGIVSFSSEGQQVASLEVAPSLTRQ